MAEPSCDRCAPFQAAVRAERLASERLLLASDHVGVRLWRRGEPCPCPTEEDWAEQRAAKLAYERAHTARLRLEPAASLCPTCASSHEAAGEELAARRRELPCYRDESRHLLSVGHSNHSIERFLELLRQHRVEVLADVRSQPISRYAPHFDQSALHASLRSAGFRYVFLGRELGGRPEGDQFYDPDGHVLYSRLAQSPLFQEGIARLKKGIQMFRVAIMCGEEDPTSCHRRLLVGRVLSLEGISLDHIRGDGRLQPEAELAAQEAGWRPQNALLFETPKETAWRSTRSVSPRSPRPSSSERSSEQASAVSSTFD